MVRATHGAVAMARATRDRDDARTGDKDGRCGRHPRFARTAVLTARDLVVAIGEGLPEPEPEPPARVSGGLARSDWAMQCLADMLDRPVERPVVEETRPWALPGWPVHPHAPGQTLTPSRRPPPSSAGSSRKCRAPIARNASRLLASGMPRSSRGRGCASLIASANGASTGGSMAKRDGWRWVRRLPTKAQRAYAPPAASLPTASSASWNGALSTKALRKMPLVKRSTMRGAMPPATNAATAGQIKKHHVAGEPAKAGGEDVERFGGGDVPGLGARHHFRRLKQLHRSTFDGDDGAVEVFDATTGPTVSTWTRAPVGDRNGQSRIHADAPGRSPCDRPPSPRRASDRRPGFRAAMPRPVPQPDHQLRLLLRETATADPRRGCRCPEAQEGPGRAPSKSLMAPTSSRPITVSSAHRSTYHPPLTILTRSPSIKPASASSAERGRLAKAGMTRSVTSAAKSLTSAMGKVSK